MSTMHSVDEKTLCTNMSYQ